MHRRGADQTGQQCLMTLIQTRLIQLLIYSVTLTVNYIYIYIYISYIYIYIYIIPVGGESKQETCIVEAPTTRYVTPARAPRRARYVTPDVQHPIDHPICSTRYEHPVGGGEQAGDLHRRGAVSHRRKGTNGVSTNAVTAHFTFVDRGAFWVLPLTYVYLPQSARAYLFYKYVNNNYLCSGPISVDPICPQPTPALSVSLDVRICNTRFPTQYHIIS